MIYSDYFLFSEIQIENIANKLPILCSVNLEKQSLKKSISMNHYES